MKLKLEEPAINFPEILSKILKIQNVSVRTTNIADDQVNRSYKQ